VVPKFKNRAACEGTDTDQWFSKERAKARIQTSGLVKIQASTLTSRCYLEFVVVAQQEVNALTMRLSTES